MNYSLNDIYPFSSMSATTTNLTVEDDLTLDQSQATEKDGRKTFIDKNIILGSLMLLVLLVIFIGVLN